MESLTDFIHSMTNLSLLGESRQTSQTAPPVLVLSTGILNFRSGGLFFALPLNSKFMRVCGVIRIFLRVGSARNDWLPGIDLGQ